MATLKTLARKLSPYFHFPDEEIETEQFRFLDLYDAADNYEFLPILPSSRLWLPRLGIGDDERFAGIFRDTWKSIPLRARRLIVKLWRQCPLRRLQGLWSPMVALSDYWEFSEWSGREPKDFGGCGCGGHSLYFFAPIVDAMPVQHVGELIAHELAHAVQFASGDFPQTDRSKHRWFDDTEIIADEIMHQWGFDPDAIDDWIKANWKWPD